MTEQGTLEWKLERLGHVTASRVADVLAKIKTGEAKTREDYRWELVTQRIINDIEIDGYINDAMQHGIDTEGQARMAYEIATGNFVDQTGFIRHPSIKWVGASPDGLIGLDGNLEIKCPHTKTHLQTIKAQKAPTKYYSQMQMQMWVAERKWTDFVSFDPRLPDEFQFFCSRVPRDEEYIKNMEVEVVNFLNEVEQEIISIYERMQNGFKV
jgi:putative phage-type endonuclease